jgi:DNA (cytosine-5)-methyltransferase 1
MNKLTALSLFSGAGGLDLGFELTGRVRVLACLERDEICLETLRINREKGTTQGIHPYLAEARILGVDISTANPRDIVADIGEPIDLVYGGPPCQAFSVIGKREGLSDARGNLIFAFLRFIEELSPKAFLFENVPGFLSIDAGEPFRELCAEFRRLGYSIWTDKVRASDFGAATFRERVFILGAKNVAAFPPPLPTHFEPIAARNSDLFGGPCQPWVTAGERLSHLDVQLQKDESVKNHTFVQHEFEVIQRFNALEFGERDMIRRRNRIDPERPAYTIFVGGKVGKLQARTHIHPHHPRELSPRECAALHGFPAHWEFAGRHDAALLQVANSVPVELAQAMAQHLIDVLDESGQPVAKPVATAKVAVAT